jgi:hypothetical protein
MLCLKRVSGAGLLVPHVNETVGKMQWFDAVSISKRTCGGSKIITNPYSF